MSMEFLIGRSLANNVTNLMLQQSIERSLLESKLDWLGLVEQEPIPARQRGLGGWRVLPRFDATMQLPAMALRAALRNTDVSTVDRERLAARAAGQLLRRQDPWEIRARSQAVEVTFRLHLPDASGQRADHPQSSVDADRHSL